MSRKDWTHCIHGHEFTPENTHITPAGKRQCRACGRRRGLAYHFKNRETKLADYAAYRVANQEDIRARERAYRVANREESLDKNARRRAGAPPDADTLGYMKAIAADPCAYCGGPSEHFDHIVPIVPVGGEHHWTNLTRACGFCNRSKGPRSLLYWLGRRTAS